MRASEAGKLKNPHPWHFTPEVFSDKMQSDTNPGRGWYQVYTFNAADAIDERELVWSLDKKERLALLLIDISCCRERPVNENEMRNIERIFRFFAEHRKEMILRPLYDREGNGPEKEPAEFSLVIGHIVQIGSLIKKYADHIHTVQGLFVGSWGEMHSSKYLSDENMKKLAETLLNAMDGKCFLSVRTPLQKRVLCGGGIRADRIALFDDGIFGSETHLGTFGYDEAACDPFTAWIAEKEIKYTDTACRFTPNGGEAVSGGNFTNEEVLDTLRRMHVSYLNRIYDTKILENWKNTYLPFYDISMYDYIGLHLGYRFMVENVRAVEEEGRIVIYVCLKNNGFACLFRSAEVCLKVRSGERDCQDVSCPADLRKLASGESIMLKFSLNGVFSKDMHSDIFLVIRHENGEYIRTANETENDITHLGKIKRFALS